MPEPVDKTPAESEPANEFAKLLAAAIAPIVKRLDAQSGIIEKLRRGEGRTEPDANTPTAPEGLEARLKALEAREREATEREGKIQRRTITQGLSRALVKHGVAAIQAEDLAEVLVSRNPDKYALSDSGAVVVRESDTESLTAESWAGLFVVSERGRAYLPGKNNPHLGQQLGNGERKPAKVVTSEDIANGTNDPNLRPSEVVFQER